ncbi:hypothetical protein G9A89_013614 [Geosiphon pyriformis]|nr:hypothetical protein G9A89_013614 [Geosiphon pyriformis]
MSFKKSKNPHEPGTSLAWQQYETLQLATNSVQQQQQQQQERQEQQVKQVELQQEQKVLKKLLPHRQRSPSSPKNLPLQALPVAQVDISVEQPSVNPPQPSVAPKRSSANKAFRRSARLQECARQGQPYANSVPPTGTRFQKSRSQKTNAKKKLNEMKKLAY